MAPPPVAFQFDESWIKPVHQKMFEGDAPFIPEYINFLKSNKIQTAPLGAQCPSGTKVEPGPPDMKCQPCMPIELQNNLPRPPDELRKKMEAWQQNINKKATEMEQMKEKKAMEMQQMKERDAGQKAAEMGGKMDQKAEAKFFTDCDFKGDVLSLRGAKLPDLGGFNLKISSIVVPKGLRVSMFKGANFTGSRLEFQNGQIDCLLKVQDGMTTWNDSVSSLIVEEIGVEGQKTAEMGGKMDQKTINMGGKIGVVGKSGFMQQPMGGSPAAYNVKQDTIAYLS